MKTVMKEGTIVQMLGNLEPWSKKIKAWIAKTADELMIGLDYIMSGNFILNARNSMWKLPLKMCLGSNK